MPTSIGTKFREDPSHRRSGWTLEDDVTTTVLKACYEAKEYINFKKVNHNHLNLIRLKPKRKWKLTCYSSILI